MRDCSEDRACWREKTGLQAVSGSAGNASPKVTRHVLLTRPAPSRAGRAFSCLIQIKSGPAAQHHLLGHAQARLADDSVAGLDNGSRRTLGLRAFEHDVTFIGGWPAVLATESEAARACAFAWICTRGKNNRLQSLLRAECRK
jgi:hypothetical protein